MSFGEIIFYTIILIIGINLLFQLWKFLTKPSKYEKEYEEKLKQSLSEEYIIDPETGAKLTLEQAESGHWVQHDNEFQTTSEEDIQKLFTPEQQDAEKAINYLKASKEYTKCRLSDESIKILENSKILSKYDDWSYSDSFELKYCNGFVFMPAVEIIDKVPMYFENDYHESQIMFWIKINKDLGHYYFREKTGTEKILDFFKNDDSIKSNKYECFNYKNSDNYVLTKQLFNKIENENLENIEIEFFKKNIFLKTLKLINKSDLLNLEKCVKTFANKELS